VNNDCDAGTGTGDCGGAGDDDGGGDDDDGGNMMIEPLNTTEEHSFELSKVERYFWYGAVGSRTLQCCDK
jgi:hypothetical protein